MLETVAFCAVEGGWLLQGSWFHSLHFRCILVFPFVLTFFVSFQRLPSSWMGGGGGGGGKCLCFNETLHQSLGIFTFQGVSIVSMHLSGSLLCHLLSPPSQWLQPQLSRLAGRCSSLWSCLSELGYDVSDLPSWRWFSSHRPDSCCSVVHCFCSVMPHHCLFNGSLDAAFFIKAVTEFLARSTFLFFPLDIMLFRYVI